MKKTVTINLGGMFFHIDEDAFDKLQIYLESLRTHWKNQEGSEEIMSDIESRVAEIFQTKISERKQVVAIEDVDEVIGILGKPEELADDKKEASENKSETPHTGKRKRLYRDCDNRILGGVCSGIGYYFNVDPVWIRLGFVLSFFFFGIGPLIYLILWFITPEARTTAEMLDMKGEKADLKDIEKNIKEEIKNVKERIKRFGNKANHAYRDPSRRAEANRFADFLTDVFGQVGKAIVIFVGIFLLTFGIGLLIAFIISFTGGGVISSNHIGLNTLSLPILGRFLFANESQATMALSGVILLTFIPVIMMIYAGVRLVFGFRSHMKIVSLSALGLWLAGLILCIICGARLANDFRVPETVKEEIRIVQPDSTLYLDLNTSLATVNPDMMGDDRIRIHGWTLAEVNGKSVNCGFPEIKIERSMTSEYSLYVMKSARAENADVARSRAKKINYNVKQKDSVLYFDPYYQLGTGDKWRAQDIEIVIMVPEGKRIELSKRLEPMFFHRNHKSNEMDPKTFGHQLEMKQGTLMCIDCPVPVALNVN
ncbi:MAG: PspC domain-containing protein [Bacteroidota bacterium]